MREIPFLVLVSLLLAIINVISCAEAPYQVSIWIKSQQNPGPGSAGGERICNGAIIHERLVITTADCVSFRISGSPTVHQHGPNTLTVVAGESTGYSSQGKVAKGVEIVKIAPGFNGDSLENDLAILRLNESLPLSYRNDIKWIILDDHSTYNVSCTADFYNPSPNTQLNSSPNSLYQRDNWQCGRSSSLSNAKKLDICADYEISPGYMCNVNPNELKTTKDRGTAFVCNNKLVGVLSTVVPPSGPLPNCNQPRRLNAYYTKIASYLTWIYQQISAEKSNNMASPFAGPNTQQMGSNNPSGPQAPLYPSSTQSGGGNQPGGGQQVPLYPTPNQPGGGNQPSGGQQIPLYPTPNQSGSQFNNQPLYPTPGSQPGQVQQVPIYQTPNQPGNQPGAQPAPLYPTLNQPNQPNQANQPIYPSNNNNPSSSGGVPLIHSPQPPFQQPQPIPTHPGVNPNLQGVPLTPDQLATNPNIPLYPAPGQPRPPHKNGAAQNGSLNMLLIAVIMYSLSFIM